MTISMILVLLGFGAEHTRLPSDRFIDILFWYFNSEQESKYCRYGTLATGSGDRHVNVWDVRVRKRVFQVSQPSRRTF